MTDGWRYDENTHAIYGGPTASANETIIATMYLERSGSLEDSRREARKNATLICAVHDLLAACEASLRVLDQVQAVEALLRGSWNVGVVKERLATEIAKAKGE